MRSTLFRGLVLGVLLVPCAAGLVAQPPGSPTDRLKTDTAALATERAAAESNSAERAKLQADLRRLLERIDKGTPGMPTPTPPVTPKTKDDVFTGLPVDQLRAATNLVQSNQIESALTAFQLLDLQRLSPEDRAFARYMTASCYRRLGRTAAALPIYRDVGDTGEDQLVSTSAVSVVSLIRMSDDYQAQLAQLRARPKSR